MFHDNLFDRRPESDAVGASASCMLSFGVPGHHTLTYLQPSPRSAQLALGMKRNQNMVRNSVRITAGLSIVALARGICFSLFGALTQRTESRRNGFTTLRTKVERRDLAFHESYKEALLNGALFRYSCVNNKQEDETNCSFLKVRRLPKVCTHHTYDSTIHPPRPMCLTRTLPPFRDFVDS